VVVGGAVVVGDGVAEKRIQGKMKRTVGEEVKVIGTSVSYLTWEGNKRLTIESNRALGLSAGILAMHL